MDSPRTALEARTRELPAREGSRRRITATRGAGGVHGLDTRAVVAERYTLLERLGAGGFGEVWRARDEQLRREVAIKRIRLGPEGDGERAAREALASARLSHPAIVALYEAFPVEQHDSFYLVSELVVGDTLAQLNAAGELEDEEVLRIGAALVGGLRHAHERGVIHRDIKPHNVLVPARAEDPAGAAKLADFGGATIVGEDALTRTGDVVGTLAYMAPEQCEGAEADERSDLYSLALVLYESLAGTNPVRGATPAATARRIGAQIPPLRRHRRDLDPALAESLDLALAPAPEDRGTVAELGEAIADAARAQHLAPTRRWSGGARRRVPRAVIAAPAPLPAAAPATAAVPEGPAQDLRRPAAPRHALPRTALIGLSVAFAIWQAASGHAGVALLGLLAIAPVIALAPGAGFAWIGAALAPVLGTIGIAGAFPALAGQARAWRERAIVAGLGYWWIALAEPLLTRRLWLGPHTGTPPTSVWQGSLHETAVHVVGPLLTLGVLLGAALWALGAALLPWVVRGRSAVQDVLAAIVWTAAIAAAAPALDAGLPAHGAVATPRGAVAGAVLAGALAVAARALRGPV